MKIVIDTQILSVSAQRAQLQTDSTNATAQYRYADGEKSPNGGIAAALLRIKVLYHHHIFKLSACAWSKHPFKLKTLWYSKQQKRNPRFATLQDIIQEQVCYRIQTLPPSSRTHACMDGHALAQVKPSRHWSLSWLSETRLHRDRKNKLSDFSLLGSLPSLTCWGNEGLSLKAYKRSLHDCLTYKGNRDKQKTHIRGKNKKQVTACLVGN